MCYLNPLKQNAHLLLLQTRHNASPFLIYKDKSINAVQRHGSCLFLQTTRNLQITPKCGRNSELLKVKASGVSSPALGNLAFSWNSTDVGHEQRFIELRGKWSRSIRTVVLNIRTEENYEDPRHDNMISICQ